MEMHVRRARVEDREPLLGMWERSVRATHHFLNNSDILALRPLVAKSLASDAVDWWVVVSAIGKLIGFLGVTSDTIEALFIDPAYHRRGGGKLLVAHAQSLNAGALLVEVNEENKSALRFYKRLGFSIVGQSPTDAGGRPFPTVHLQRPAPGGQVAK
jgi:putative acetyltransferase